MKVGLFSLLKIHFWLLAFTHYSRLEESLMAFLTCKKLKKDELTKVYNMILHRGLLTHNPKASNAPVLVQLQEKEADMLDKKGAIFTVRDKSHFTASGVKGVIMTSKETLLEQVDRFTHFTPNVYRHYQYADSKRRYIKGFEEQNLQQINAFVIDIDTKEYTLQDIFMACLDDSIGLPTIIVETDRGYQVYFLLVEPIFISNKNNFLSLTMAKRIADNLKRSLKSVGADIYCNDFGFFRMPNSENMVWFDENAIYNPATLIDWSIRRSDDDNRPLFVVPTPGAKKVSVMDTEWFQALIHAVDIKGKKGQIGRNNTLFTLALACLQEGWSKDRTMDFLDEFNYRLNYPLSGASLKKILESAYSGKYHGPAKEYVEELLAIYVPHRTFDVKLGGKCWYKFKKAREDRERSHCHEWEQDLIAWMTAEKSVSEPFIWRSQKELCEAIGIANSTLNKLLKESKQIIKTTTGKGRNAKTGLTTVELYIQYIIWLKQDLGTRLAASLRTIVQEQMALLEPSAGYTTLAKYVQKLLQEQLITEQLSMAEILMNTG